MSTAHDKPGLQALRKGRASLPHHVYLVTTVCHGRRPHFGSAERADPVAALLHEGRLWRDSTALCWVLMPDHLHIVLQLGTSEPLSRLMNRVKSLTSRAAGVPGSMPIWMRGFHDRALRRDEDLAAMIRYVGANPWRAGLVAAGEAYPYLGGTWKESPEGIEAAGMAS
jgi:REP element-mobilizing transposase RayT